MNSVNIPGLAIEYISVWILEDNMKPQYYLIWLNLRRFNYNNRSHFSSSLSVRNTYNLYIQMQYIVTYF